ncbi:MAG: PPOX class F420-dependent oxidoreductase [Chloroflexota bacterium]|nr:PPOX class F420-dependent oxidoreductase [Chloroflexota bacterium]
MFTEKERAYIRTQPLVRLATISPAGQPDAAVAGFELDGDDFVIGSFQNLEGSRKYQNIAAGGEKVSLVIDHLAAVEPMTPVAVKVHGTATIEHRAGKVGPGEYLVIRPKTSWSWGVEGPALVDGQFQPRKTVWSRQRRAALA